MNASGEFHLCVEGDVSETGESFAVGEIPTREGCDLRLMLRNLVPVHAISSTFVADFRPHGKMGI